MKLVYVRTLKRDLLEDTLRKIRYSTKPIFARVLLVACVNLYIIWRIRSLRKRTSSQWRQQPISSRRLWGERVQLTLAIVTLVLVAAEFLSHHYIFRLVG